MRNRRFGCTGEFRTEERSRAFFIFWSVRFRSVQSIFVEAKNSSSAGVRVDGRVVVVVVTVVLVVVAVVVMGRVIQVGAKAVAAGMARRSTAGNFILSNSIKKMKEDLI